ncbi:hypothetical protein C2L65_35675 [Paraburkholderia terrae]|uniref:Uncharacterized protein n=2 Tax=Paraburkholderia terrae TaxID=311230 RepID=A0A2I8EZB4_9BURK|nr:hypothetical protein C2L65_35675 [Paraburkholderia terrae]
MAGGSIDPMSLVLSQLGGAGADDPRVAVFMNFLAQRQSAAAEQVERSDADQEATDDGPSARNDEKTVTESECSRRMLELSDTATRMFEELEVLRVRNDTLAAALGACFLCFGTDFSCTECRGRGKPGARLPEPAAYRDYVLPALRRIRAAREASPKEHGNSPHQTAGVKQQAFE